MKKSIVGAAALITSALPGHGAREIVWTATGSVTSAATAFSAPPGSAVSIRISYQSQAVATGLTGLFFPPNTVYMKTDFNGNVGLLTEIRIGDKVWQGWVAKGASLLVTEAWDVGGASDVFKITASSANGGEFGLFPYSGSATARSIQFNFTDDVAPAAFISAGILPDDKAVPQQITKASGSVAAGTDMLSFSIDPASVTVTNGPERSGLTLSRSLGGITLAWPSELDTTYRLEDGDLATPWQSVATYPGTGQDIVVQLNPFPTHPARRFYRVASE